MIVYSERIATVNPRYALAHLENVPREFTAGRRWDALIAFGQFESGVTDALHCREDCLLPLTRSLRRISESIASAALNDAMVPDPVINCLREMPAQEWPETIEWKVPEGFAYYALYPEQYVAAARAFEQTEQPSKVVVIGIRSIGASLASVVASALRCPAWSCTVRPRGHPFDRVICWTPELRQAVLDQQASHYAVVDEGPGLSGSSFLSVVKALRSLGIEDRRIVLFPAWAGESSRFLSAESRREWDILKKFCAAYSPEIEGEEVSGGAWRQRLFREEASYPAAHPHHERRKFWAREGSGNVRSVSKFSGLGEFGRANFLRASALADAGFVPRAQSFANGYLSTVFLAAEPLRADSATPKFLRRAAAYVSYRRRNFPSGSPAPVSSLLRLLDVNLSELFGAEGIPAFERRFDVDLLAGEPAVLVDGRMLPHEWIVTPEGNYSKTDAVDHCDDHFFPGPQDPAWDLAGLMTEFRLSREYSSLLLDEYRRLSQDRQVHRRLPFYRLAYPTYRAGYCTLSAQSLAGGAEGERFRKLARIYRRTIRSVLEELALRPPAADS